MVRQVLDAATSRATRRSHMLYAPLIFESARKSREPGLNRNLTERLLVARPKATIFANAFSPSSVRPKLCIGKIKTIEDAQLLSFGTSRGRLVVAQCLRVVTRFIELGAFADQSGNRKPRHVEFVGRAAGWSLCRANLSFDDAILGQ